MPTIDVEIAGFRNPALAGNTPRASRDGHESDIEFAFPSQSTESSDPNHVSLLGVDASRHYEPPSYSKHPSPDLVGPSRDKAFAWKEQEYAYALMNCSVTLCAIKRTHFDSPAWVRVTDPDIWPTLLEGMRANGGGQTVSKVRIVVALSDAEKRDGECG